ncbi:TniQ family protein [Actinosynnema sp. NPDC023587]|uniref:TniQ family protein n=1 Tax=Actinosynnema sp. NPDC023587 TaxID=3154695 RepID=UPI0033DFAFB6
MTARALPIRIRPLLGEAIDSWLEALAARHNTCWSDLLNAVGLSQPTSTVSGWIARPAPDEAATLVAATAENLDTVQTMALARYHRTALRVDPVTGTLDKTFPWSPPSSSRFCPPCLAETGGRWQLAWRLGWSFACLRHHRLLSDTCPACRQRQRRRAPTGIRVPVPGRCANPLPGSVGRAPARCGADLTEADTAQLPADHPCLKAQQAVHDIIDTGTADFGVYAFSPQSAQAALTDIRIVANRVLAYGTTRSLGQMIPADLLDAYPQIDDKARPYKPSPTAPAPGVAAAAAIAVTAALAALGAADAHRGGDALRWLVTEARGHGAKIDATSLGRVPASPVLNAIQVAALAPTMSASDQLRHRVADPLPARAQPGAIRVGKLARGLPTMLWPAWSLRLSVPGPQQRQLRPALSAVIMFTGTTLPVGDATDLLGRVVDRDQVSRLLGLLAEHRQWGDIRQALAMMGDHLTVHSTPIDYRRRRRLDYTGLLTDQVWKRICRDTGASALNATATGRRARCYLFERLSGLPADTCPAAVEGDHHSRSRTADFARVLTPTLADALNNYARDFLAAHDIHDEPPTWQPPTNPLDGLSLPGDNPSDIDIERLHQLIRHDDRTLGQAAEILGTTRDTVRHLVEIHPAPPAPEAVKATAYQTAKVALPPDKLAEFYLDRRMSTADIAEQVGVRDRDIARLARDYRIPLRQPGRQLTTSIDRDWLHDQYIIHGRSLTALAREAGVSWRTMAEWAQRHNVPLRRTNDL